MHSYLRASVRLARETERIGPFFASYTSGDATRFLNYAIPDEGAAPTGADIAALTESYWRRDRLPRLEYVPAAALEVEVALLEAGWRPEGRLPLMVLPAAKAIEADSPAGVELVAPATDAELLATVTAQSEAYGSSPPGPGAAARLRQTIERGGRVVLARFDHGGDAAGGGLFPAPYEGVTEIAAIGVRPAFRRRGIATSMVRWLVREARNAGVTTVFLMAESPVEEQIYVRIGFETVGEMLHIARPSDG